MREFRFKFSNRFCEVFGLAEVLLRSDTMKHAEDRVLGFIGVPISNPEMREMLKVNTVSVETFSI